MSVALWLAIGSCAITALGVLMTRANLARLRPAPGVDETVGAGRGGGGGEEDTSWKPAPQKAGNTKPLISVCIPARNEAANIEACVRAVLASTDASVEVLVYDDQSTDETPRILARLCEADPRVRRVDTIALPPGWNGKQHACWRMAGAALGEWLIFTDADVRFAPSCVARAVAMGRENGLGMVSAFPRQVLGTVGEAMAVPMIFFILLMYLPFGRMRKTLDPSASAACGQFLCVSRAGYDASGGHAGFRDSMHDGVKMPRALRRAGFKTDLFDGSDLLECRMYRGWDQTWRGFTKNAFEGLSSLALLVFLTVVHGVGYVLPPLGLVWASVSGQPLAGGLWALAMGLAMLQIGQVFGRNLAVAADPNPGAATVTRLFPGAAVLVMTLIQWESYRLHLLGRRTWRGRGQSPEKHERPVKTA